MEIDLLKILDTAFVFFPFVFGLYCMAVYLIDKHIIKIPILRDNFHWGLLIWFVLIPLGLWGNFIICGIANAC